MENEEILDVNYNPLPHKIGEEILKLFNNGKCSANPNNEISLMDCVLEFTFKSKYTEEEIFNILEEDEIFKNILHKDCIGEKYYREEVSDEEDMTDLSLWSV
jgi:hypothetical protein